jgi:hypothetical protein
VIITREPIETNHYSNLFIKESIETNHFGNLFIEDLIETQHFGYLFTKKLARIDQFSNLFIKESIEFHTKDMLVTYLVEIGTNCNLSNQELVELGIGDMLEKEPVEKVLINPILVQINDVSINLVTCINFLEFFCLKRHIIFQASPSLILWL